MAERRCSLDTLLAETQPFGMARLARLLLELASDLELAMRTGVCSAQLSSASVLVEHAGTERERARLPLAPAQPGEPALQPALREMGALLEQLGRLKLGVEDSLSAPRPPSSRRADQPLLHAWRRILAVIARRCASAGAYPSAAELVRDLERLSRISQRIVARRRLPPHVYVSHPKPALQVAALPKVMLRCA